MLESLWDRVSEPRPGREDPDRLLAQGSSGEPGGDSDVPEPGTESTAETEPEGGIPIPGPTAEPVLDTSPNVWNLDMAKLAELSGEQGD